MYGEITHLDSLELEAREMKINPFNSIILSEIELLISVVEIIILVSSLKRVRSTLGDTETKDNWDTEIRVIKCYQGKSTTSMIKLSKSAVEEDTLQW